MKLETLDVTWTINDVLPTFLSLECGSSFAVYTGSEMLADFFKNILICLTKMNKGLVDLKRREGE